MHHVLLQLESPTFETLNLLRPYQVRHYGSSDMRLSVQDVAQNFSASLLSDDTDTSPMHAGYPAW